MRVPRVFAQLPPAPAPLTLEGEEATHLVRVLRIKPGAEVEVFDGEGRAARLRVAGVARRSLELEWVAEGAPAPALPTRLSVATCFPKGKRAHRLLEGLTELGVDEVLALELSRSPPRSAPDPEQARRWAVEAAKQCGRNRLPVLGPALDLEGLLARVPQHPLAVMGDTQGAQAPRRVLEGPPPPAALVVVGPEGGFSDEERARLREAGVRPLRLGVHVLRVETAAVALVGALLAALGQPASGSQESGGAR